MKKCLVESISCYQTTQEAWWWWGNSRDLCQNCALYVLCVSLEALARLVAYLQVAILLTLQSYHLETGRRFLSIYTLPDYKVPLQLPSWGVSQSLDRNEVWLRSQHSRWTNISINDTKCWLRPRVRNYTNRDPSIGCLRYPQVADIWDIITPVHALLSRCFFSADIDDTLKWFVSAAVISSSVTSLVSLEQHKT